MRELAQEARGDKPNPLLLGLAPQDYVLQEVQAVKRSDLQMALMSLPFTDALKLMSFLPLWGSNQAHIELVCYIAT